MNDFYEEILLKIKINNEEFESHFCRLAFISKIYFMNRIHITLGDDPNSFSTSLEKLNAKAKNTHTINGKRGNTNIENHGGVQGS